MTTEQGYPPNIGCVCGLLVHVDMPNVIPDDHGELWHEDDNGLHRVSDDDGIPGCSCTNSQGKTISDELARVCAVHSG